MNHPREHGYDIRPSPLYTIIPCRSSTLQPVKNQTFLKRLPTFACSLDIFNNRLTSNRLFTFNCYMTTSTRNARKIFHALFWQVGSPNRDTMHLHHSLQNLPCQNNWFRRFLLVWAIFVDQSTEGEETASAHFINL